MIKDLFCRYIWIVDTIFQAGKISLAEINERWLASSQSDGRPIPRRTFINSCRAIENIFDINIECERKNGYRYYIENVKDVAYGGARERTLGMFAVNNIIRESRSLRHSILFEEIPSGQKFLIPIIEAMRQSREVVIEHKGFGRNSSCIYTLHPYCLKVFRLRWYVAGYCRQRDTMRIFSLDRIQSLTMSEARYEYPDNFDPMDYFSATFGVVKGVAPHIVEIKVYGLQRDYLRALPLHHSQQETEVCDDYSVFRYYVSPSYDFKQEILSMGVEVEVLSPVSFREEICRTIDEMAIRYR